MGKSKLREVTKQFYRTVIQIKEEKEDLYSFYRIYKRGFTLRINIKDY